MGKRLEDGRKAGSGAPEGNHNGRKHGLFTLRRALVDLGSKAIDGRSHVGVALRRWKQDLISDLGGKDSISTQQETLIELAARSKIMLDSIDTWILGQPTLINARKKTVLSVVQQRQTIADGLTRIMKDLGLERRVKQTTLDDILNENDDQPMPDPQPSAESAPLDR